MQTLLNEGKLLDNEGNLIQAGYATQLVRQYDRKDIKASKWRIKEWDYYYLGNQDYGVALTIADNSYMTMCSLSFLDFKVPYEITKSQMTWFSFGKLNLPSTSKEGDLYFKNKVVEMTFKHENGKRHVFGTYKNFGKNKEDVRFDLYFEETNKDTMVIATPFKKKQHFYYNQKINLLKGAGYFKLGNTIYDFSKDSYGVLDWGRGVWTYKNTWYWSSLNTIYKGQRIGFNLGYGFGDTSAASENMFFYNDKAYKLEDVTFDIPIAKFGKDDFMSPWTFRSKSGDISMKFTPIINRHADTNVLLIRSNQNQVFGKFSGYVIIEGKEVYFDNLLGFAEKVYNKW